MPTLKIQGTELQYEEQNVITFKEGLIGLPQLRRLVMVRQSEIEPFFWLACPDADGLAFVVAEARNLFAGYDPSLPADSNFREVLAADETPLILAVISIAGEWQLSTANLRAPIFISPRAMCGAQVILTDPAQTVDTPLPFTMAA
jgi:flagellar assembly factor FliW